jgi:inorganic pyrophosphatase
VTEAEKIELEEYVRFKAGRKGMIQSLKEWYRRGKRIRSARKAFRRGWRAAGWTDAMIDHAIKHWGFGPNINEDGWVEKPLDD